MLLSCSLCGLFLYPFKSGRDMFMPSRDSHKRGWCQYAPFFFEYSWWLFCLDPLAWRQTWFRRGRHEGEVNIPLHVTENLN